jgi:lipopolysaccharide/colanic/teichoic acid biosynthesis glycosyltransferase
MFAYYVTIFLTLPEAESIFDYSAEHMGLWAVFTIVWYAAAFDQRLYISRRVDQLLPQLFAVAKAFVFTLMASIFIMSVLNCCMVSRMFVLTFSVVTLVFLLLTRSMLRLSLWGLRIRGWNTQRIVIVGANEVSVHLVRVMLLNEQYGYQILGFLEDDLESVEMLDRHSIAYLGKIEALEELLTSYVVDCVYVCLPIRSHYELIQSIAHLCEGGGVSVRVVADLLPLRMANASLWRLEHIPFLSLSSLPGIHSRFLIRRSVDWIASSLLLIVLSPFLGIIALFVKLSSEGPIFVKQTRVRRDGRKFGLLRFRCYEYPIEQPDCLLVGPQLTRLGVLLRRYGLDVLPSLWNVWLGQMSLSGPRPPVLQEQTDQECSASAREG